MPARLADLSPNYKQVPDHTGRSAGLPLRDGANFIFGAIKDPSRLTIGEPCVLGGVNAGAQLLQGAQVQTDLQRTSTSRATSAAGRISPPPPAWIRSATSPTPARSWIGVGHIATVRGTVFTGDQVDTTNEPNRALISGGRRKHARQNHAGEREESGRSG
jgi:hypothetical protein